MPLPFSTQQSDNDNGEYSKSSATIIIVSYEFIWIRIGDVTIFSRMLTIACCLVVALWLGLGLGLG